MPSRNSCSSDAKIRLPRAGFAVAAGAAGLLLAASAQAEPVDCGGASIGPLVSDPQITYVQFTGTCNESLLINRSDLTLDGGGTGVIHGTVYVRGDRIQLSNLTVRGDGGDVGVRVESGPVYLVNATIKNFRNGAEVRHSAATFFFGTTIKDNSNNGIFAQASAVTVSDSTIKGNGNAGMSTRGAHVEMFRTVVKDNARFGLSITENSNVRITDGKVAINVAAGSGGEAAIGVFRQSQLRLLGTPKIENSNPDGRAMNLAQQAWLRQGDGLATVASGNEAIRVAIQSGADLREFDVQGIVDARDKSFLNLRNGTVNGNVRLRRDSDILFSDTDGPVTVNGDLLCNDADSKATPAAGTVINGASNCAGFL